jgi:hypothetical protein
MKAESFLIRMSFFKLEHRDKMSSGFRIAPILLTDWFAKKNRRFWRRAILQFVYGIVKGSDNAIAHSVAEW